MKIGILGGTFDPIHKAHLRLAEAAQKQYGLDRVLFIPALIPPHKNLNQEITPAQHRYRMVELAIAGHPEFEVSDLELKRPDVSFTVDTLRIMQQKYPSAALYLIMGADSAASFSTWRQPEEIAKIATLLVARRPGFKADSRYPFHSIETEEIDLAATELRKKKLAGQPFPSGALLPEIEAYIQKMNLYQKVYRGSDS